jgi:hypothetical protein
MENYLTIMKEHLSVEVVLGLIILAVLLAFFSRVEAARLVVNPDLRPHLRFYILGTLVALEHTVLLVVSVPLALLRWMRPR